MLREKKSSMLSESRCREARYSNQLLRRSSYVIWGNRACLRFLLDVLSPQRTKSKHHHYSAPIHTANEASPLNQSSPVTRLRLLAPIRLTNEATPLPLRGQVRREENRCAVNRAGRHTVRSQ